MEEAWGREEDGGGGRSGDGKRDVDGGRDQTETKLKAEVGPGLGLWVDGNSDGSREGVKMEVKTKMHGDGKK